MDGLSTKTKKELYEMYMVQAKSPKLDWIHSNKESLRNALMDLQDQKSEQTDQKEMEERIKIRESKQKKPRKMVVKPEPSVVCVGDKQRDIDLILKEIASITARLKNLR